MRFESGNALRTVLLNRISTVVLVELVNGLGDESALLDSMLRLAMRSVYAEKGLAFNNGGCLVTHGLEPHEAGRIAKECLGARRLRGGVRCYAEPGFQAPADVRHSGVGAAVVLRNGRGRCVVAVERHRPFEAEEIAVLHELSTAIAPLLDVPGQRVVPAGRSISASDLPLSRVHPLPHLEEMERLLIAEALARCRYNKTAAAIALGITREGLRKKIIRLGIDCAEGQGRRNSGRHFGYAMRAATAN